MLLRCKELTAYLNKIREIDGLFNSCKVREFFEFGKEEKGERPPKSSPSETVTSSFDPEKNSVFSNYFQDN